MLILKICHWTFLVKPFNKTRFWKSSAKISLKSAWNFSMNCMRTKMLIRNSTNNLARIWNWASTRTLPTARSWPASWGSSLPLPAMSPAAWETMFQGNLTQKILISRFNNRWRWHRGRFYTRQRTPQLVHQRSLFS